MIPEVLLHAYDYARALTNLTKSSFADVLQISHKIEFVWLSLHHSAPDVLKEVKTSVLFLTVSSRKALGNKTACHSPHCWPPYWRWLQGGGSC